MDDNLAIFLVMTVSIAAAVILTLSRAWLQSRHKLAQIGAGERIAALGSENARLTGEVSRLVERMAVLERIATDPGERTAREIEMLR